MPLPPDPATSHSAGRAVPLIQAVAPSRPSCLDPHCPTNPPPDPRRRVNAPARSNSPARLARPAAPLFRPSLLPFGPDVPRPSSKLSRRAARPGPILTARPIPRPIHAAGSTSLPDPTTPPGSPVLPFRPTRPPDCHCRTTAAKLPLPNCHCRATFHPPRPYARQVHPSCQEGHCETNLKTFLVF